MTNEEVNHLPTLSWMPSRIPVRDALVASVKNGIELPEGVVPPSYEQRWYPQQNGTVRLLVPYDGGPFDSAIFHVEPKGWDHTTCDLCNVRISAMTVCYVTKSGSYHALCSDCYAKHIVSQRSILRQTLWHAKRLVGIHGAA